MFATDWNDPRLQPGAYITNGQHLYEVREQDTARNLLAVQNCKDDGVMTMTPWMVRGQYRLVQAAPTVEDVVPDLVAA
jgi:hypothetical protein